MRTFILSTFFILAASISAHSMTDKTECKVDADCVPAACCHNAAAVNKEFAPDCHDISCTGECKKPYDCGCSEILCLEKKCILRIKESMKGNPLCGAQSFL